MEEVRTESFVKALAELAMNASKVEEVRLPDSPSPRIFALPHGKRLETVQPAPPVLPDRIQQSVRMVDVDSFIRYVNEHKDARTRIFASVLKEPFGLKAIIDYHLPVPAKDPTGPVAECQDAGRVSLKRHVCLLEFTPTDPWREWAGNDGKAMAQDAFAAFVEERQPDICEPSGADVLELARSIEATRGVKFDRRIRLENGDVALHFDDKTQATAGMHGRLRIPDVLKLKFPIFLGMPNQVIDCRFRYRLDGGTLWLSYEIVRRQQLLLDAMRNTLDIVTDATEVPAFLGVAD